MNGDKRILAANVVQQPKWVQSKMSQFVFNLCLVFLSNEESSSSLEAANGEKATIAENLSRGGDFLVTKSGKCGVNTAENTGREENTQREIGGSTVGIGAGRPLFWLVTTVHCTRQCQCNGAVYCNAIHNGAVTVVEFLYTV